MAASKVIAVYRAGFCAPDFDWLKSVLIAAIAAAPPESQLGVRQAVLAWDWRIYLSVPEDELPVATLVIPGRPDVEMFVSLSWPGGEHADN